MINEAESFNKNVSICNLAANIFS